MNLRQQFFWKLLLGLSTIILLFSIYNSYSKYIEYHDYKLEYDKESEVKGNKKMEEKTNFISQSQARRINLSPNLVSIDEKSITKHGRAGIKTNSKLDWDSGDPIYKGMTMGRAMIDYRNLKGKYYKQNDQIEGTKMVIKSFSKDSVIIDIEQQQRVFYTDSYTLRSKKTKGE
tara:strand:+ start:3762 stop:4280 length:519 start_codon:yes stop_codon:yes gene_type:complete